MRPGAPRTPDGVPKPFIIDWQRRRRQQQEEEQRDDREQPSVDIEEPTIDIEHEEPTENIDEGDKEGDRGYTIIE